MQLGERLGHAKSSHSQRRREGGPQPSIEEGGVGPFKTTASILYITVQKITKINKLLKLLTSL